MANGFNNPNWTTVGDYSGQSSTPWGNDIFTGGTGGWQNPPKNTPTFGDYSANYGSSSSAFSPVSNIFSTKNANVLSDVFGGMLNQQSASGDDPKKDDSNGENKYQDLMEQQNQRLDALEKAKQYQMERTHQVTPDLSIHYPYQDNSQQQPYVMQGGAGGAAGGGGEASTVQKVGRVATGLASAGVLGPWGMAVGLGAQLFG